MDAEELQLRTKQFAHRSVKLALAMPNGALGDHVKRRLSLCATSVASNYRATCLAQSRPDFASKLSIVVEEADESAFWMEFAIEEGLLREPQIAQLLAEAHELRAIFIASRKTAKDRTPEFNSGSQPGPQ